MSKTAEHLSDYEISEYVSERGNTYVGARKGNLLASITEYPDGRFNVTGWVVYSDGDKSYCEDRNFKTVKGAVRMARNFLDN